VVRRYLRGAAIACDFVRNITDIDDKIIRRAAELGEPHRDVHRALHPGDARGLRPPRHPASRRRAARHAARGGMIALTKKLIDKGHAYVAPNGDVMYSVASFEPYGQLSGKRLADLRAGSRVEVDEAKRDPLDFVLWKRAKPGEPSWPSPWGAGPARLAHRVQRDVARTARHAFRHPRRRHRPQVPAPRERDRAVLRRERRRFAQLWMHNGFVNVDDEKMSKSLGNFFTIRTVLDSGHVRHPEVLRFFLMSSHYRGPINYSPGKARAGRCHARWAL
jgi:cysteinyl-tRNA synthetase